MIRQLVADTGTVLVSSGHGQTRAQADTETVLVSAEENIKITGALGNKISYAYDAVGRLIRVIDELGINTGYTYNFSGNKHP